MPGALWALGMARMTKAKERARKERAKENTKESTKARIPTKVAKEIEIETLVAYVINKVIGETTVPTKWQAMAMEINRTMLQQQLLATKVVQGKFCGTSSRISTARQGKMYHVATPPHQNFLRPSDLTVEMKSGGQHQRVLWFSLWKMVRMTRRTPRTTSSMTGTSTRTNTSTRRLRFTRRR